MSIARLCLFKWTCCWFRGCIGPKIVVKTTLIIIPYLLNVWRSWSSVQSLDFVSCRKEYHCEFWRSMPPMSSSQFLVRVPTHRLAGEPPDGPRKVSWVPANFSHTYRVFTQLIIVGGVLGPPIRNCPASSGNFPTYFHGISPGLVHMPSIPVITSCFVSGLCH